MPELPDVEIFKQYFDSTALHQEIEKVDVSSKQILIVNVYSDEILFQAGIHPGDKAGSLDEKTVEKLYKSMGNVIEKAIASRVDPGRFPKSFIIHTDNNLYHYSNTPALKHSIDSYCLLNYRFIRKYGEPCIWQGEQGYRAFFVVDFRKLS